MDPGVAVSLREEVDRLRPDLPIDVRAALSVACSCGAAAGEWFSGRHRRQVHAARELAPDRVTDLALDRVEDLASDRVEVLAADLALGTVRYGLKR